jgi:PPOX class probable F420-dependent enzyme
VTPARARELFAVARVARLATVRADGAPHLVPVTFALDGDRLLTAVDAKPKRHRRLRRLSNVAAEPRVSLLVDHYDEDWSRLWWVRADGEARVADLDEAMIAPLAAKYPPYADQPPAGPAIVVDVDAWISWSAGG